MKNQIKTDTKPSANISTTKQKPKRKNKLVLFFSFLFLSVLLVIFLVPVYYIPLFNNISSRYGLSADISRQLSLLDLALSSLGIETSNMATAFKQNKVEYEPEIFLSSRINVGTDNHLINAKEISYYKNATAQQTKNDNSYQNFDYVAGVRALPEDEFADFGDYDINDNTFTKFSNKKTADSSINIKNTNSSLSGQKRQARGSFDRKGGASNEQITVSKQDEPLPDFVSSIYNKNNKEEIQTLENSRMIKPVVKGQSFSVLKRDRVVSQMLGNSNLVSLLSPLKNFGGYGALGYYVKDDLPTVNLLDFFGARGEEVFLSYFYSNAAVTRKYGESSKHLAEAVFNGEELKDKILVARGQEDKKLPEVNPNEMSPLELLLAVKHNLKECKNAGEHYRQIIGPLSSAYKNAKNKLMEISEGPDNTYFEGLENVAVSGAPGSCEPNGPNGAGAKTARLRAKWNNYVGTAKQKCIAIREAGQNYANACKMDYTENPSEDTCESISALEVEGGTDWINILGNGICRKNVKWHNLSASHTFNNGCNSRNDCKDAQTNLFKGIEENVQLQPQPNFVFAD